MNLKKIIKSKKIFFASLFVLTCACSFMVRTSHFKHAVNDMEIITGTKFVPFFVESSIMYSYTKKVATGKGIEKYDKSLLSMGNVPIKEQMTLSMEYFLGLGYRLKKWLAGETFKYEGSEKYEDNPDVSAWVRFQIRLWTCLTAGLVFIWLTVMNCPWPLALAGGVLHSFAPAAIARYTGQDLVRGQFALPILTLAILMAWVALKKNSPVKLLFLAVAVFTAFASWDMCQIIFSLFAVYEIIRLAAGGTVNSKRRNVWTVIFAAVVLSAVLVPYNRAHSLASSPLVIILIPMILSVYIFGNNRNKTKRLIFCLCSGAALLFLWKLAVSGGTFSGSYGHFGELLKAKIVHCNVKPADPEKLNFITRYLWTPAMHSATFAITRKMFPAAFYGLAALFTASLFFRKSRLAVGRDMGRLMYPLIMAFLFFSVYIFVVRMHVFCILFTCVALPMLVHNYLKIQCHGRNLLRISVIIFLLLLLASEIDISLQARRAYPGSATFRATNALIQWFRESGVRNRGILADMTISPLLKAYCGEKILLQPKFEMGNTRELVEKYIKIMFHGTEEDLNRFCVKHKIEFLVHDSSYNYAAPMHIYCNRYMAAAKDIKTDSPAWIMSRKPDSCKWFYYIHPPDKLIPLSTMYKVFKVIRPDERIKAMKYAVKGISLLKRGYKSRAKKLAREALSLDPAYPPARVLYSLAFDRPFELQLNDFTRKSGEKQQL